MVSGVIWFFETTFMRFGRGKAGTIGNKLRNETLKTRALNLHMCGKIVEEISNRGIHEPSTNMLTVHIEKATAKITADKAVRRVKAKNQSLRRTTEP